MKTTGRPKKELTDKEWASVEYMAIIHCTGEEMAGVLGIDYDTFNARIRDKFGCNFSEWYKEASAKGNMSLRRSQWKSAEGGNVTMQIFLGKQWLGQKDKIDANINNDDSAMVMKAFLENVKNGK